MNEIPEDKKNEYNENKLDNVDKAYDKNKDDFFDDLKLTTKDDMKNMAKNYNLKNMDTFKLEKNSENDVLNDLQDHADDRIRCVGSLS